MEKEPSLELNDIDSPLYDALGVDVMASKGEIINAYRRLAREWHPDRHRGDEGAKLVFQQIARAYQILKDPEAREQHDLQFGCLDRIKYIQDYLQRYFYMLLSPQGLGLQVNERKTQQDFTVELNERLAVPISAS